MQGTTTLYPAADQSKWGSYTFVFTKQKSVLDKSLYRLRSTFAKNNYNESNSIE
jgi:hypothetical protein